MRAAPERLKALDKDQDGNVGPAEIPATISVLFRLGNAQPGASALRQVDRLDEFSLAADGVLEWFTRMDRNRDGDLTLKEFLGDESDFRQLDSDGDGFIDRREARAAEER